MPRARTTDDLLTDVRARVTAATANDTVSTTELLSLADQEMRTELAHLLISIRSEYWLSDYTTSVVANQSTYRLPDRALGMALRDVTITDSDGYEYNAVQVPADQRYLWTRGQNWAPSGPFAFTLDNGSLVLLPTPTTSGYTLRMRYYRSPSKLVEIAGAEAILGATTTTITVDDPPISAFSTAGTIFDIVRGAGMFDTIAEDLTVDSYDSGSEEVTFSPALTAAQLADISTGAPYDGKRIDFACIAGETVYPPLPESVWPLLVALTCRAYCEAIKDTAGMEAAAAMYERKRAAALGVLTPRVDGEVRRPVALHTPLRSGRRYSGWGR